MADKTIKLEIVTPEKKVFSEEVEFVTAPGAEGLLGILPEHAPLITSLTTGIIKVKQDGKETFIASSSGFMEVKNNKITILVDTAEKSEDIDVARAKAAKERAEQRLTAKIEDVDLARAEAALKRALTRLQVANFK